MVRIVLVVVAVLGLAAGLLAMNVRPFLQAKPEIRSKDLSFLPSPEIIRLLAVGHFNSAQRLRWIDSFAYLQLQFDRRDDTVAGGHSGFTRLFDGLLALDPHYHQVYQHAAVCLNGIITDPHRALSYLVRGNMEIPDDFFLWQHTAAVLTTNFRWDETHPEAFDAFLTEWAEAMTDPNQREAVLIWRQQHARRSFRGLDIFAYWQDRLVVTTEGSPMARFIEGVMRQELVKYAQDLVTKIRQERAARGLATESLNDCLDGDALNAVGIQAQWGPISAVDGQPTWRHDPWGWPFGWEDGRLVSPGLKAHQLTEWVHGINDRVRKQAQERGRWPASLAEITEWGISLPALDDDQELVYRDQVVHLVTEPPSHEPWPLRPSALSAP